MERARIICESPRLILRQFMMEDLEPLAAMHSDSDVCRFIGGVKTREQSRENLEQWIAEYAKYGVSKWAVVLRSTGEFIGRCGFSQQIEGAEEWELGWTVARRFWGKGYATEAAAAAMKYWFGVLKKPRLISLVHPLNQASIRVATRLGMTLNRTVQWHDSETNLYVALAPPS